MKKSSGRSVLLVVLLALTTGGVVRANDLGDRINGEDKFAVAFQTVFHAVLEGCFADGLTDADVDQLLRREAPDQLPVHFITNCPICTATQCALETYRSRPLAPNQKTGTRKLTFGKGLMAEMHARLYSDDLKVRLAAIHDLEENWVSRWIDSLRLKPEELARTQTQLRAAREEGMRLLQIFLEEGTAKDFAPGYREGDECALCNAAAGMELKLATSPAKP